MSIDVANDVETDGQVTELMNRALAPVEAPAAVKRRLRDEILEAARLSAEGAVRLERNRRVGTWVIGAALGTAVAVASGVWLVLRKHLAGDSVAGQGTKD